VNETPSRDDVYSILFVCTANRFRSPLAASTLARELQELPVQVSSRGTLDVGAMPPLPLAITEAQRWDLDVARHRARPLVSDDVAAADLVVGFERPHLVAAAELGAPADHVFALDEVVTLLERLDRRPRANDYPTSARVILSVANKLRDPRAAIVEIDDPVGRPAKEAAAIAQRLHLLALRLARALSP